MGIIHIYDLMGTEKLKFLFMDLRRFDTTGKLMLMSMQNTQLECGLGTFFYNLNYDKWHKLVCPTWNTHLWQYCDQRATTIDFNKNIVYKH